MRTTIDLPTDLHHAVRSIAAQWRQSTNQTVVALIRRGLAQAPQPADTAARTGPRIDAGTGLPLIHSTRPVSVEDVRALEDE